MLRQGEGGQRVPHEPGAQPALESQALRSVPLSLPSLLPTVLAMV